MTPGDPQPIPRHINTFMGISIWSFNFGGVSLLKLGVFPDYSKSCKETYMTAIVVLPQFLEETSNSTSDSRRAFVFSHLKDLL
jgi:hypothetical protein